MRTCAVACEFGFRRHDQRRAGDRSSQIYRHQSHRPWKPVVRCVMDMVLKRTGHRGGGNLAKAYASYGTRVSGPQVGAIAVMGRRGGGHVGVVSGVDPNSNPIVVSGNHNRTVAESVYPAGRISAYVLPGG